MQLLFMSDEESSVLRANRFGYYKTAQK